MTRILLTGGSGDLGQILAPQLLEKGYNVRNIDIAPSKETVKDSGVEDITASILERDKVEHAMQGVDVVIHIAAWHGIHEPERTPYDFHDLNVTGTMNVFEAAAKAGCKKVVFVSSTSVSKPYSVYGHSKILNEEQARAYSHRHGMDIVILRPRAFIPSWNRTVYKTFADWANWFMRGAVHIDDVAAATLLATEYVQTHDLAPNVPLLPLDGGYEYTQDDLETWDEKGEGSTFIGHYGQQAFDLLKANGINPAKKPKVLDISQTRKTLGYAPAYSLKSLIEEVKRI